MCIPCCYEAKNAGACPHVKRIDTLISGSQIQVDSARDGSLVRVIPLVVQHHVKVPAGNVGVPGPPTAPSHACKVNLPLILAHSHLRGASLQDSTALM